MPVRQSLIALPRRLTIHNPQRHRPRVAEGRDTPLFTKTLRFLRLSSFQTVLWCTSSVYRSELVPVHRRILFSRVAGAGSGVGAAGAGAFSRGNRGAGRENRIASRVGRADLTGCAVTGCAVTGRGWRSYAGLRRASSTRLWATAADQM